MTGISTTIYYTSRYGGAGRWIVTFWTKPDRSNALTESFVTIDEERIRFRISNVLGIKNFTLEQVRGGEVKP